MLGFHKGVHVWSARLRAQCATIIRQHELGYSVESCTVQCTIQHSRQHILDYPFIYLDR